MWQELKVFVDRASYDPEIKVIVLTSALEKYWTAGLDRKSTDGTDQAVGKHQVLQADAVVVQDAQKTLGGKADLDPARQALLLYDHVLVSFTAPPGGSS